MLYINIFLDFLLKLYCVNSTHTMFLKIELILKEEQTFVLIIILIITS